ncbi:MAG TPA: class I SAM-dependent methyltransferase [Natronosporangium sp.]
MTTATTTAAEQTADQLIERLLNDAIAAMETYSITLGLTLGLYQALAAGETDARQLAERAGIHPRYAREWLEHQAVLGILQTDDADVDPYARVFRLPDAHREVLLDDQSPSYFGLMPGLITGLADVLPQLADAYRSGGGVPFHAYGEPLRHGIAGLNRPMYRSQLGDWLAALPDIQQALATDGGGILDLGCGTGSSTLTLAELFPNAQVHGVDLDTASVAEAREQAKAAGLNDRVTFTNADAASLNGNGSYQLVCVFEAFHDMADPIATLRAARALLAPGGAVLIGDERVAERFAPNGDWLEQLNYGFSVLHCLPATRAEGTAVEAGTVIRPGTVAQYAEKAGFRSTVLPIEHDLWRFYRLDPVA